MARLCERPGCSAPAVCTYGFDSKRLSVWIEAVTPGDRSTGGRDARAGSLCRRHADSMVVPIGWKLDDRRVGGPVAAPEPLRRPAQRRLRKETKGQPGEQLALLDIPPDAPHDEPPQVTLERSVLSPMPSAGEDHDLAHAAEREASEGAHDSQRSESAAEGEVSGSDGAPHDDAAPEAEGAVGPSVGSNPGGAEHEEALPAAPWRPVFDQSDDLGGLLQARSPLLARAFGRRTPPPSPPPASNE